MKQRHPVLDPRVAPPVADGLVRRVFCRLRPKQRPPVLAKATDAFPVERHLRHGPQHQLADAGGAALRCRVEPPQAFDRVAEQVNAYRVGLTSRVDVDNAAAHRILAVLHHGAGAAVAVRLQEGDDRIQVRGRPVPHGQHRTLEQSPRRHTLHQRVDGCQHDRRRIGRVCQPGEGRDALADDFRVGRHPVIRQAVPGREAQHGDSGREKRHRFGKTRHSGVIARDMQNGTRVPGMALGKQDRVKALRRTVNSGSHRLGGAPG